MSGHLECLVELLNFQRSWIRPPGRDPVRDAAVIELLNRIHRYCVELLQELWSPGDGEDLKPIADWTRPWSRVLVTIYGDRILNRNDLADRQTIKACDAMYTALGNQKQVPDKFETMTTGQ